MITLCAVRRRGFNIGNEAIFLGLRHLAGEAFGERVNIVSIPAVGDGDASGPTGLSPRSVHEMNLAAHGVIVGGGNVYENGQLDLDAHALRALRPPLMLFSLSHGRIYDHRRELIARTDSMPDALVRALDQRAALSVARDDATLAYLRSLGLTRPRLGGCPSLLLRQ